MSHLRNTKRGRAFAAILAAMDRFDETEGKLTNIEWVSILSAATNHLALQDLKIQIADGPTKPREDADDVR